MHGGVHNPFQLHFVPAPGHIVSLFVPLCVRSPRTLASQTFQSCAAIYTLLTTGIHEGAPTVR